VISSPETWTPIKGPSVQGPKYLLAEQERLQKEESKDEEQQSKTDDDRPSSLHDGQWLRTEANTLVGGDEKLVTPKKSVQFARKSAALEQAPTASPSEETDVKVQGVLSSEVPADAEQVLQRDEDEVRRLESDRSKVLSRRIRSGSDDDFITHRSVLKRDRMLVKVEWTAAEDLPPQYDELVARRYSTYTDDWSEYMVVLRMGRLELWEDTVSLLALLQGSLELNFSPPIH